MMVTRTVQAYARAGVAGLHIEDQVQEKRCGHLMGKQLVDRDIYYSRLRAAVAARDDMGSDMVIIARTDARAGEGFEEAVERLKGAVECGVDMLFLEALKSHEEAQKAAEIFKGTPMLLNMVPGGVTPDTDLQKARDLGFKLIIFPTVCLESVVKHMAEDLKALKETGMTGSGLHGVRKCFEICGLQEAQEIDQRAGGKAFSTV